MCVYIYIYIYIYIHIYIYIIIYTYNALAGALLVNDPSNSCSLPWPARIQVV